MVDYLLSILVSVVVCLLLNGLIRLFRKKPQPVYRQPDEQRIKRLFTIASFTCLQQAMLSLENGSYAETLSKAEAALKRGPDEVHKADEQVLGICGDLFRVILAFS